MSGVSESVLEALVRALELDDAERAHLFDLARAAQPTPMRPRRRQTKQGVRPEVQWTLDAITGAAAFVGNERLGILVAVRVLEGVEAGDEVEAAVRPWEVLHQADAELAGRDRQARALDLAR